MKKYTKILSALLAVVLCLSLVGCGSALDTKTLETSLSETGEESDTTEKELSGDLEQDSASEILNSDLICDYSDDYNEYRFDSFEEIAALRNALRTEGNAFEQYHVTAENNSIETVDEAEMILETIGSLPIPMITDGNMKFSYMRGTDNEYNTLAVVYLDDQTGDFLFFVVTPNCTLEKYLSHSFGDAERTLLTEKQYGGYNIEFYRNPSEKYADDIWWTIGLFEVDNNVIAVRRGCDPRYGNERNPDITLDDLTAPLEHLTVTTILEQIGE